MREILPYPSTLVGYPIPLLSSSYPDTFKRKHDKPSYYLKFSANPLREHVKFLSRHTRWVAGSSALSAYRFLQTTPMYYNELPKTAGIMEALLAFKHLRFQRKPHHVGKPEIPVPAR